MIEHQTAFILDPKHEGFPDNREELMEKDSNRALYIALFVMSAMTVGGLIIYNWGSSPDLDFTKESLIGMAGIFFGTSVLVYIRQTRRYDLYDEGQLLDGTLVTCTGESDSEGGYYVRAVYRFHSPSGKTLSGKTSNSNYSSPGYTLPAPGTSVHILYRSDRQHMML